MQLITKSEESYYLIIPHNLFKDTKEKTITAIKKEFIKYNQKYQLLEPGFYELQVFSHNLVGTVLAITKIDSFDFTEEIDLQIILKDNIKIYLQFIDPFETIDAKREIDIDTLTNKQFLSLLEHTKFIIKDPN